MTGKQKAELREVFTRVPCKKSKHGYLVGKIRLPDQVEAKHFRALAELFENPELINETNPRP